MLVAAIGLAVAPARLAAPEPETELELGEEDEIRPRRLGELERLAATRGAEDVEAVVAQLASEVLARLGLGLGDEDCARHGADASPSRSGVPGVLCGGKIRG